ncbi:MAG TPA: amidase [Candidatus Dormibacteraeota bacterium]|nr:amidase [Candidatus Dormibacteraeota bacterium]
MTWTALELADALRAGRCSAVEVAREHLDLLDRLTPVVGAVAATDPERTLADAAVADRRLRAGEAGRLEGVPLTVKDWIDVEGWPVSGATGTHGGDPTRRPAADATAVARLRAAGAVVLAITRTMASSPRHGQTRNPHDPARAPGGSSSGAAALVAAGGSPLALGSDSGGSIRLPAAWCGVAGLKPTFGRVPLTGHFPRCGSLEDGRTVIGPLARTVDDLAAALALIAGPDGLDAGVAPVPMGDPDEVDLGALRVGVIGDEPTAAAVSALAAAGAAVVAEHLPDVRDEALELTRRYWGRARLSGEEIVRLLWDWDRFRRRLLVASAGIDVVVTPATEGPAPPWRESVDTDYSWMLPWSLTGAPVVVVPVGSEAGLPVAVQVVGRPWQDHVAIAAARCIEAAVPAPAAAPDLAQEVRGAAATMRLRSVPTPSTDASTTSPGLRNSGG